MLQRAWTTSVLLAVQGWLMMAGRCPGGERLPRCRVVMPADLSPHLLRDIGLWEHLNPNGRLMAPRPPEAADEASPRPAARYASRARSTEPCVLQPCSQPSTCSPGIGRANR